MAPIAHRGPDGLGLAFPGQGDQTPSPDQPCPIGLGHQRLAIIDLTETGNQPMHLAQAGLWLVFNGEIYNFVELREQLQARGRVFRSTSDSEVILQAYDQWGPDCLKYLNGMFALAIYNEKAKELFLARDRIGIKPLYYTQSEGTFYWGSELKQFAALPQSPNRPDLTVVRDFLVHGVVDHGSATLLEGVSLLSPGTWLTVKADGRVDSGRFHDWPEPVGLSPVSEGKLDALAVEFMDLLADSVKLRLRADVPVGSCLSGGLDSSLVVCLAADILRRARDKAIHTAPKQHVFTAAYEDKSVDERNFAQLAGAKADAVQHLIFPKGADLYDSLADLVWTQDGLVDTMTTFAQYKVMEEVSNQGIKVTLDGQGADELLGGYAGHLTAYLAQLLGAGKLVGLAGEMKGLIGIIGLTQALRRLAEAGRNRLGLAPRAAIRYQKELSPRLAGLPGAAPERSRTDLGQRLYQDAIKVNMPRLLHYADRNSMRFGVEARLPFLDHRLVEFCLTLPPAARINRGWSKYVLRRAGAKIIPDEIRWRKDKIGFSVPRDRWYPLGHQVFREILTDSPRIAPLVKPTDWPAHVAANTTDRAGEIWLWRLSVTELAFRQFKLSI